MGTWPSSSPSSGRSASRLAPLIRECWRTRMEPRQPKSQMEPRQRKTQVGLWIGVAVLAAIVALATTALTGGLSRVNTSAAGAPARPALESILSRGTLRCGYVSNPPACIVDPNTGKVSGIFVEAMEAVAKGMELKLEWTEEVGFGAMIEGLQANRYDMVPCAIWPTAARARQANFSIPLYYSGVGVYVRASNDRFNGNLPSI